MREVALQSAGLETRLVARPGWNLRNKSVSTVRVIEGNFVSRYTSASV